MSERPTLDDERESGAFVLGVVCGLLIGIALCAAINHWVLV
jgi:hypothetical protein